MHILLSLSSLVLAVTSQPMVEVDDGWVQGNTVETHYGVNVNSFYGIPFAEPPTENRRFSEPRPALSWAPAVFNATRLGNTCIQTCSSLWATHPGWDRCDEDCLNLNVFTPEDMDPEEPYPVMVWLYGGAYESGGNIMYPGHFYAARDVVYVVPNYRIGIMGFLTTGDEIAPGNYGLYDQRMALEWVQQNIRAFGGDPDRVTIFGQSAGSSSASLQILSPDSAGLFHQVIGQSGSDMSFWAINWPEQEPWTYPQQTAQRVGCPTEPAEEMVDCLKELDQWVVKNNSWVDCTPGHFCQGHAPVIDGIFIPDYPLQMRKRGEFNPVGLLQGWNSDDGSLYTLAMIPETILGGFNRSVWQYYLEERLVGIWREQFTDEQFQDTFAALDWFYTPWPYLDDNDLNLDAYNMMVTDAAFGFATQRQLEFHNDFTDTYQFIFGMRSTNASWDIIDTDWIGVPHSGELPYTIGWAMLHKSPAVKRDSRILFDFIDWNDEDVEYSEFVIDLWTNYAKYGTPTPEPIQPPNGLPVTTWEKFSRDEMNYFTVFSDYCETRLNYRSQEHAFFTDYLSYILDRELFYTDPDTEKPPPRSSRPGNRLSSRIFEEFNEDWILNQLEKAGIDPYVDINYD